MHRIAAVSGSCSPVTARQIQWARANGFSTERLHLPSALATHSREREIERIVGLAAAALNAGRSALVFSAEGPEDASVVGFDAIAREAGLGRSDAARAVGAVLAKVMRQLVDRVDLQRVVVAGGDSSGEVASALDIEALTVTAGLTSGAPLCRAWSRNPRRDGLGIVLKGGQMGEASFFEMVRDGNGSAITPG